MLEILLDRQSARFNRREILMNSSAAALLWGCQAAQQEKSTGIRALNVAQRHNKLAIDVHCHIFNASDLPVRRFVERVVFGVYENPSQNSGKALLGGLVARFASNGAVTAAAELRQLSRGTSNQVGQIYPSTR